MLTLRRASTDLVTNGFSLSPGDFPLGNPRPTFNTDEVCPRRPHGGVGVVVPSFGRWKGVTVKETFSMNPLKVRLAVVSEVNKLFPFYSAKSYTSAVRIWNGPTLVTFRRVS